MGVDRLLEHLRRLDALRDLPSEGRADRIDVRSLEARPPEYAPREYMDELPEQVRDALRSLGIERLYAHQAEAIERIRSGSDVVLEAPTAAGKTLCFNVPLVWTFLEEPNAHALMIHPMKALSNDQRRQFEALAAGVGVGAGGRRVESWVFDGDLEPEHRRLLKANPPAVLFTNPEMLHLSFLGWQNHWDKFLRGLRMVVLDEIHEYRGYFGTNVALLLRRFFARLDQMGVRPQLVLATATCGNAEEHARRLTGRACELVRAHAAMRPKRHFVFIEPDIPDYRFREIFLLRIARAALACVDLGLTALIFCPSRRFAEEAAIRARRDAEELGIDPEAIAPYRSGYDAKVRREVEDGLRSGRYRAVFSTNALEIGVDIGKLDVCVLAGFPDSVLSAWQRIGRAGRSWTSEAYVLFYASNNPFDRFFARNLDAFLEKPLDAILIGVDNEEIMSRHLPYLVHECDGTFTERMRENLGEAFFNFAKDSLAGKKPLRGRRKGPNYRNLSIRAGSGGVFRLKYKEDRCIGEISEVHRFREAYVGAVYNHFGRPYRVKAHGDDEVILDDVEPYLRTEGFFYTAIQIVEGLDGYLYGDLLAAFYGRLRVYENFTGYRLIDTRSGEVIEEKRVQTARSALVRGFWLEVDARGFEGEELENRGLFSFEQLVRIGAPFVVPCDRYDLATCTQLGDVPTVFLYETVPGGIGVAEKALEVWTEIVQTGMRIAERCGCVRGCPGCIVPPRLPPGYEEPRKDKALAWAKALLGKVRRGATDRFDPATHSWVPV